MAATIKIKNSSTASAIPTSSDLVQGELAVNVTDKRLFTENASGTVVELGTNPSTLTVTAGATIQGLTVGKGAGAVSTNTAVGASALSGGSQTGTSVTAIGYESLLSNTSGVELTAVGRGSLRANTTGNSSTAVGRLSLAANTTGGDNAALGNASLNSNTTGSYNTALGSQALISNTTASYNTAVGYQAGYSGTTDYGNTFLGTQSGYSFNKATAGSYTNNTFVGISSGYYITTGQKNTIIGAYTGNQGGLDIRTSSNFIVLSDGDGNPLFFTQNGGGSYLTGVYVDTTASAANTFVRSDGRIQRSTSALKYKQDIRDLEEMDISLLRSVRYKSKCEDDDQTKDHLGLIADEAAEAGFEELVTRNETGEVEGFQYERLTVVLLKKLQVLEAKVKELEAK